MRIPFSLLAAVCLVGSSYRGRRQPLSTLPPPRQPFFYRMRTANVSVSSRLREWDRLWVGCLAMPGGETACREVPSMSFFPRNLLLSSLRRMSGFCVHALDCSFLRVNGSSCTLFCSHDPASRDRRIRGGRFRYVGPSKARSRSKRSKTGRREKKKPQGVTRLSVKAAMGDYGKLLSCGASSELGCGWVGTDLDMVSKT